MKKPETCTCPECGKEIQSEEKFCKECKKRDFYVKRLSLRTIDLKHDLEKGLVIYSKKRHKLGWLN